MTDDVPEPQERSAEPDPGEALAAQPPDDPVAEAAPVGPTGGSPGGSSAREPTVASSPSATEGKVYTPKPYNPMTIDVNKTQGNRVISTLDLRAKRAATLKGD